MRDTVTFDKDTPVKLVEIGYYSFVERNDFVACPRCRKRLYAPMTPQAIEKNVQGAVSVDSQ